MKKILLLVLCLGIETLSAVSTSDYDRNNNEVDFGDYGYSNPIDGFVGSYLAQPFNSSHYFYEKSHLGADFMTSAGTNVYSICDGSVIETQDMTYQIDTRHRNNYNAYYNSRIIIQCNQNNQNFLVIYGHVDNATVTVGANISQGDFIAEIASAYNSNLVRDEDNDHLHFGINVNDNINYGNGWGFGVVSPVTTLEEIHNHGFRDPFNYISTHSANSNEYLTRSKAIKLILDKFNISSKNAGFNTSRFGEYINIPDDVNQNTTNYDYIVTAYNRGIVSGSNSMFEPNREVTLAEFLIMVIRTIPIPMNNPNYESYNYHSGDWYYKYLKVAYNAGLIDNKEYDFDNGITEETANDILNKAYNYFLGKNSGISIYGHWTQKYVDFDVYLYSKYNGDGTSIDYDKDDGYTINNMYELRNSGGIVYWNLHSSNWGANLDYDSWGGNGSQPWAGFGEERITVDSQMVRRPGTYDIIFCYYNGWDNYNSPNQATIEWWGINAGQNINVGGKNFKTNVNKGECVYAGTLNTH
jgi:hypothetical protein